jgi:hypothetical protein
MGWSARMMKKLSSQLFLLFIIFLLLLSVIPYSPFIQTTQAAAVYPTFGVTTALGTAGGLNVIRYFTATNCTSSGIVKSLSAYIVTSYHIHKLVKAALYQWVSNTNVGNLLATCTERDLYSNTGDPGWVTFDFNTSYTVSAGTKYVLAIWSNASSGANIYYGAGNGGYVNLAYTSWPSPITSELDQTRNYSMYVTYTRSPTQSTPSPVNASTGIDLTPTCAITVADVDADSLNVQFYENSTGTYVLRQTNSSVTNGTYRWYFSQASTGNTKYWWRVNVIESGFYNVSAYYHFTTFDNVAPVVAVVGPANGSTGVVRYNRTSALITDADADATTVCLWENHTNPGSWTKYQQNNSVATGTTVRCMNSTWALAYNTPYWWRVTAYDGHANSSSIYKFTTIAGAGPYSGPDYYVNVSSGGDGNNGSLAYPWATIEHAVSMTGTGDTIYIMAGTYTPSGQMDIWTIHDFMIRNYNNDVVIVNGTNCPKSNWIDAVFDFSDCYNIRVSGITIEHSARGAITFRTGGSHNLMIDNCSFIGNAQHAVKTYSNVNNLTIENNYIFDNDNNWSGILPSDDGGLGQELISLENPTDFSINNNTILNNHFINIDIKGGGKRGVVCYNDINTTTTYYTKDANGVKIYGEAGIYIDARGTTKNISIYNNRIWGNNTGININNEAATGHFEYIYIYNNVVNMTRGHFGLSGGYGVGRMPIYIGNEGLSSALYHHIYVYSNTLRTGADATKDYPCLLFGRMIGSGGAAQFTTSNLGSVYVVNNIMVTQDVDTYYLMSVRDITWAQAAGIFTVNNNSFYRSTGTINIYWGSTGYSSSTPSYFGGEAMFSNPKFTSSTDEYGDFTIPITSICRDTGSNLLVPSVDFDGVVRPHNSRYDIGAYEYNGALQVFPTDSFNCDNEYYSTTTGILFQNITLDNHWFNVNGIGFNISSTPTIYVNFSSIASHPKSSTGWILNWTSDRVGAGTPYYWINGLKPSHDYILYSNMSAFAKTTLSNGSIQINQTTSKKVYQIYDVGIPTAWYVSLSTNTPAGSDITGTGSITAPFATLRKAINASTTSDTIIIRGGDYTQMGWDSYGTIYINRSGTKTDPFTIQNYTGEKVVIDGKLKSITSGYGMFRLYKWDTLYYHNVSIIGLNFSNCSRDAIMMAGGSDSCNDIIIDDCDFFNITYRAIYCYNEEAPSPYIENITVSNCNFKYIQTNGSSGECVTFMGCKNYVFENNSMREFHKQGVSAGGSGSCYGNIRYNSFENKYYIAVKFTPYIYGDMSCHHINVYNNLFYGTAHSTDSVNNIMINPEENNNYVHNISIYNNIVNVSCAVGKYSHGINIYTAVDTGIRIENITIKYNTVYCQNGADSACMRVTEGLSKYKDIVVANNIFINNGDTENQVYFMDLPKAQTNVTLKNNLYYNVSGGTTSGCYYTDDSSDIDATSLAVNPMCVAYATGDFHLNSTSPAIGAASTSYLVSYDYDRVTRPQAGTYDIGAYERVGGGIIPYPPTATSPYPISNAVSVVLPLGSLNITIADQNADTMNLYFRSNHTGVWTTLGSNLTVTNGTYRKMIPGFTGTGKRWWSINCTDGAYWTNKTFNFTIYSAPPPTQGITLSKIRANWTTSTSIYLLWSKGPNCTNTYVYRSTTGYMTGAVLLYSGTNAYYNNTLLSPTIRYYYTLKPYNSVSSLFGPSLNVSLAETDNLTSYGASWLDFKGYMITPRDIWTNFRYSTSSDFTTTFTNRTTKIEYYETSASATQFYSTKWKGQTFKVGTLTTDEKTYLYNVSVKLYRDGSIGTLTAYLYSANTTGLPVGAILASGTKDVSTVTTSTSGEWVNITMTTYYLLSNTRYAIALNLPGTSGNKLYWLKSPSPGTYTGGRAVESDDSGVTWSNYSVYDFDFRIFTHKPYTIGTGLYTANETTTTTSLIDILQGSLSYGWMYYYRLTGNDTKGNMTKGNLRYSLTKPDAPVFLNYYPSFANNSVNITWANGLGANRTIIVYSHTAYPSTVSGGTIIYNGTGTWFWEHNISFNISYYFCLFSFTVWDGLSRFSYGVHIPWGGVTFIVYNESSPWQVINASILVTDSLGQHPIQFNNVYGYYSFNISQIPYGTNTLFYITNSSYHSRLYPITIIQNIFYNFSFYIPPLKHNESGPPGGNLTGSYRIQIINDYQVPVQGALLKIYRYLNTTSTYTYIGGFVSDGNGQGSIDLFPFQMYMVKITCDGYDDITDFWTPTLEEQSLPISKTFKIYTSITPEPGIFDNLIVTIEPEQTNFYDSFTAYFNVTSSDAQLEWMTATMSRYNSTTATWACLYSLNTTTTIGGSISYIVPNITGIYQWSCSFGKTGFSNYTIVTSYSIIEPGDNTDPLNDIVKHIAGRSPIYIPTLSGETVVSWTALIAAFVAIFILFGFSPKFSGLAIMATGGILGFCKEPLGIVPNSVLSWIACGFIIILGLLVVMADKKEEAQQG